MLRASPITLLLLLRQLQAWLLNCVALLQLKVDSGLWGLVFCPCQYLMWLELERKPFCMDFYWGKAVSRSASLFLGFLVFWVGVFFLFSIFPIFWWCTLIVWVRVKYLIDHIMKNQRKSCQFCAACYVCSDGFDCSPLWTRRKYLGVPNYSSSERKFRRVILASFIAFMLASERVAVPLLSDFTAAKALMATLCNPDFSCLWDWINASPSAFSKTILHARWAAILVYTCFEVD